MTDSPIRLLLSDVDGTLVTSKKELTPASIRAVDRLREAGIRFAVTSGRPPKGMEMLVGPLALDTPVAAFNGGMFVTPQMEVLHERALPAPVVPEVLELLGRNGLETWVYRGADWLVPAPDGPHVDREAWTVRFAPTVVDSFDGIVDGVVKICGVSDDHDLVARVEAEARERFGDHVSAARSQPYYLDVTHPDANKGGVVHYLAEHLDIPTAAIATIGDMPNDVLMFGPAGLGIAMGNAGREVQRAARRVTTSNDDDGFARAVERFVLPHSSGTGPAPDAPGSAQTVAWASKKSST
jgi:Cof subfamily protein (haloacid dehalogenase superfamily)